MTAALLQRLTVLLSFLMAAFLTVVSGWLRSAPEITLYSIFWVVVTFTGNRIRKP